MPRVKSFPYTTDAEMIPTAKNLDITPEIGCAVKVMYACPSACWIDHLEAWRKARRDGNMAAPCPMPEGHCMFEDPVAYGMIPYGCTDAETIRAAHEKDVRALLDGWDRDTPKDKLDAIVKATVDARLAGVDVGGLPFTACLFASM